MSKIAFFLDSITTTESTLRRQEQVKTEVVMADASEGDEEKRERKKDAKKRSTNGRSKKTNRKHASFCATRGEDDEKLKMEVGSSSTASVAATCTKSDGKRWHCKRKAHHPHSLCDYHLSQVRSYYSNGVRTTHVLQQQQPLSKQNSASIPDKMNTNKKKTTTKKGSSSNGNKTSTSSGGTAGWTRRKLPSDFFYYYSGFGPSRGKRRSDGGGHREGAGPGTCDVDANDGDDGGDGGGHDGASLPWVHDQGLDDLDDDGDEDDLAVEYDVVASRRRRRKPVKARSLKSLL